MSLPVPELPQVSPQTSPEKHSGVSFEMTSGSSNLGAPQTTPVAPPISQVPQQPAATPQTAQPATNVPAMADDLDLIEKEWVVRAKQIVNGTREDPFAQSRELNKIKAEYVKKRYNKDIKLPES